MPALVNLFRMKNRSRLRQLNVANGVYMANLFRSMYFNLKEVILRNVLHVLTTTARSLPHKCSKAYTINPSGRMIYKKQIECAFPECKAIFKKARQFDRHYRTVHIRAADQKLDCTIEGCRRTGEEGFSRKDNLIQHMRSVHGEEIPKNLVRFNGTRWDDWGDESQPMYTYLVKGTSGSIGLGVAG
jgi:hypothetical protein